MFPKGVEVEVVSGHKVVVTVDDAFRTNQTADKIWISYKDFPTSTHIGARYIFMSCFTTNVK